MKITKQQIREMIRQRIEERCQKGYKTHPTRKTKVMFGRRYRNCVKAESVSKGVKYHMENNLPITECIYRLGSDAYFATIKEVKELSKKGAYNLSKAEQQFLNENPELGEWAWHEEEGQNVPLGFPMYIEASPELYEAKKKKAKKKGPLGKPMRNTGSGKKYKVYMKDPKTGNIRTITYGDQKGGLEGNWNSAEARKSYAKRHRCAEKKDRMTAGYWACRAHKDFGKNVPGRFW
jgi:hypothetical protein|tara:strand:- start:1742 stop:2443 length:702 start_codon:yes stop_codon:yes gene_type:complete